MLKQLIKELNWQYFDIIHLFELWDIHMWPFGDIKEYTVEEVQEYLHLEVLAPTETQIKKEFAKPFIFNFHYRFFIFFTFIFGYLG